MIANFYNFLIKTANARPYLLGNDKELLFEMTETYGFIISFKEVLRNYQEEEEDDFLELEFEEQRERRFLSNDELLTLPSFSHANYVKLYTTEIYGYREDENIDDFRSQSISKTLYKLLRELFVLDKNVIIDYCLDTNEGFEDWGSMCSVGEYFNYLFLVNIKCTEEQLIQAIELLVNINVNPPTVSMYTAIDYVNLKKFIDIKKISILNTNTKARRLGYLKLLGHFFIKYPQSPYSQFYERYERFVIPYQVQLLKSSNARGVISLNKKGSASGNSAKPYIELAYDIGFINTLNNIATVSKPFKVYVELLKQSKYDNENPFQLELIDKAFFGESIFSCDFFYMSILLEIIYIRKNITFSDLKDVYMDILVKRLSYFQKDHYRHQDRKAVDNIKKIDERVRNWNKPERYLEHVLMPRLNWLVDLGLIALSKPNNREVMASIIEEGEAFFECLCDWYDLKFDWIINPDSFISSYFPQILAVTYGVRRNNNFTDADIKQFIISKIETCFNIFQTLAVNRVTLSQAISYIQLTALVEVGLSLSKNYLDKVIQNDLKELFIYRFQAQFGDGYLQKVKI